MGEINEGNLITKLDFCHSITSSKFGTMDCPICFDTIEATNRHETNCHHIFHEKCIERWFAKGHQCPMCRKSKFDMSLKEYEIHFSKQSNKITSEIEQCKDPLFKLSGPPNKTVSKPGTAKRYRCRICGKLHVTRYRYNDPHWEVFQQCTRKGSEKWVRVPADPGRTSVRRNIGAADRLVTSCCWMTLRPCGSRGCASRLFERQTVFDEFEHLDTRHFGRWRGRLVLDDDGGGEDDDVPPIYGVYFNDGGGEDDDGGGEDGSAAIVAVREEA